jgi:hypothetical protein
MENSFAYLESIGKSKVWKAYADNFANEDILEEGFNPNSGYVYIALENGISIASCVGQDVEYIVFDNETENELILDNFEELETYLLKQN